METIGTIIETVAIIVGSLLGVLWVIWSKG
jgi:hypothetical protein